MRGARLVLGVVMVVPLLAACPEETPKEEPEPKFIEYLEVVGTCVEDHVRPLPEYTREYTGHIVHWFHLIKNKHTRMGSIRIGIADRVGDRATKYKEPYKYLPPSTVRFRDVPAEQLAANTLTLKGLSEGLSDRRYEATCTLKVERRLNCWPVSKKEVEENRHLGQDIPAHWCDPDTIDPREKK